MYAVQTAFAAVVDAAVVLVVVLPVSADSHSQSFVYASPGVAGTLPRKVTGTPCTTLRAELAERDR